MNTQLKDVLAVVAKESLRAQVDEAFNKFKQREQRRIFATRALLAAAATVLLFLAIPFLTTVDRSPEALFSQNFEMPEGPSIRRDGNSDRLWVQALDAYDRAQYAKAADFIESALKNASFEDEAAAYYLLGMCFSAEARYGEAIQRLEKVNATGILYPDAQWYIALFCLKTKDVEKAKKYLTDMAANDGHFKQREAAAILRKLE
jgi:tetratricopeptide (TPR) repeat protein